MAKNYLIIILLLIFHSKSIAKSWPVDIPIIYDNQYIGSVISRSNGFKIDSIEVTSLTKSLENHVKKETLQLIVSDNANMVTTEKVSNYGVHLKYIPSKVEFELNLDSEILLKQDIFLSDGYKLPDYDKASDYTIQNTFNTKANYSTSDRSATYGLEVYGAANFGGVYGANLVWSGNVDYSENTEIESQRGPIQLFFERPDIPLILSLGNLNAPSSSYISSVEVSGIGISRSRSQLRPTERVSATPNDEFLLLESAQVTILLNGYFYQRISLPAGRYTLQDLPISSGANDVTLQINYTSGRYEEFEISNFYDATILAQGFDDFNLAIGFPVNYDDNFIGDHDSQIVLAGDYKYGLTDFLTLGTSLFYHPDGSILGANSALSTAFGSFSVIGNYSTTNLDTYDSKSGTALGLTYSYAFFTTDDNLNTSIRINSEFLDTYINSPWIDSDYSSNFDAYRLSLNQDIIKNINVDLTASYIDYLDDYAQYQYDIAVNFYFKNFNFRLGYEYEDQDNVIDDKVFFEMRYSTSTSLDGVRLNANYKSIDNNTRLELSKGQNSTIGSYGGYLSYEYNDNFQQLELDTDYLSKRTKVRGNISSTSYDGENNTNISGTISTTLAIVDGQFSIGSQPLGAIALFSPYEDLNSDILINPISNNEYDAISNISLLGHYTLIPHSNNNIFYDVPDSEIGYNIGEGVVNITPGSYTGHIIPIGSKFSKTVIGKLIDTNGNALQLVTGNAYNNEHSVSFFTNSAGRFVFEGVTFGEYHIEMSNGLKSSIVIPKDKGSIIHINKVIAHE